LNLQARRRNDHFRVDDFPLLIDVAQPPGGDCRANTLDATSAAAVARTQLLLRLEFTEDISCGNDPVYVSGTRLRRRQFTQAGFALDALNFPRPLGADLLRCVCRAS
jgi:hypothetical protein